MQGQAVPVMEYYLQVSNNRNNQPVYFSKFTNGLYQNKSSHLAR